MDMRKAWWVGNDRVRNEWRLITHHFEVGHVLLLIRSIYQQISKASRVYNHEIRERGSCFKSFHGYFGMRQLQMSWLMQRKSQFDMGSSLTDASSPKSFEHLCHLVSASTYFPLFERIHCRYHSRILDHKGHELCWISSDRKEFET